MIGDVAPWALVAFSCVVCVMMLWWPLGFDQGIFAFVGDVVVRGGTPYVDAFESRGPLSFYVAAAIQLVFGRNAFGVRVVDVALALLTAGMLWHRLSSMTTRRIALVTAAAWPVIIASLGYHHSAQFDLWVGTAMLGCALLVTRASGYGPRELVAAGALVGLASLTKPFYPAFLAVPGIVILFHRGVNVRAVAADLGWLILGWLAPIVPMLAWLWSQGALREAWEVHIMFNLRVYSPGTSFSAFPDASPMSLRVRGLWFFISQSIIAVAIAPIITGLAVLWQRQRAVAAGMLVWLIGGTFFVLLQGKFWPYQWTPIYPALVFLCAVGLHAIAQAGTRAGANPARVLVIATTLVMIVLIARGPEGEIRVWSRLMRDQSNAEWYYQRFTPDGVVDPAEERAVARYIRTHTRPGERFAHWSLNGALPFLADRPHVSRFSNKRIFTRFAPSPVLDAYKQEYVERIRTLRPTYIAVSERGDIPDSIASPDAIERALPELATVIANDYALETRVGLVNLYRLRAAASATRTQ